MGLITSQPLSPLISFDFSEGSSSHNGPKSQEELQQGSVDRSVKMHICCLKFSAILA